MGDLLPAVQAERPRNLMDLGFGVLAVAADDYLFVDYPHNDVGYAVGGFSYFVYRFKTQISG